MRKSTIFPEVIQSLFDSAKNAADKGQAQYFTGLSWAKLLAKPLCAFRDTIVDLTCGNGQLLAGARTRESVCLGLDIENMPDLPNRMSAHFVNADLCRFYPKLCAVNFQADCFVLNPPFDLHFYRERLALLAESDVVAVRQAYAAHDGRTSADTIDSTIATLCIALDRCSTLGEGFLIANESTVNRLIFADGAPHAMLADHIWAHLIIPGNITSIATPDGQSHEPPSGDGRGFKTAVLYFARAHVLGCPADDECVHIESSNVTDAVQRLAGSRSRRNGGEAAAYMHTENSVQLWDAARDEHLRETGKLIRPKFNIWLDPQSGEICTYLNLFDTASGVVDPHQAAMLNDLNGRKPIQLLVQREQRQALQDATKSSSPWKVDPGLQLAIDQALVEYNAVRAPLYPLSPIKRLGFLDEHDEILCAKTIRDTEGRLEFVEGEHYKIRSTTIAVNRFATKRNNSGDMEKVMYNGQELAFFITNVTGLERSFMEGRFRKEGFKVKLIKPDTKGRSERDQMGDVPIDFTLEQLTEHFEIPAVPDVATLYPERYTKFVQTLRDIEIMVNGHSLSAPAGTGDRSQTPFAFRKFQIEDYCRAALHDGVILGHDTGLGKTIAMFIWPILKVGYQETTLLDGQSHVPPSGDGIESRHRLAPKAPVLLIVPGDGHDQTDDESMKHFHTKAIRLDSQDTFLRLSTVDPRTGRRVLPPAYYITSYTQLTSNGVAEFPEIKSVPQAMTDLHVTEADLLEYWNARYNIYKDEYQYLGVTAESTLAEIHSAAIAKSSCESVAGVASHSYEVLSQFTAPSFSQLKPAQRAFIERAVVNALHAEQKAGIGSTHNGIKCVYSPSLSDLGMDTFAVCVIDEGTKIKGDDTIMGTGVRQINAPHRLILTATPIKNRFPDIFHLAHYVTGGHDQPTPRFPYGKYDKQDICDEFLATEQSLEDKSSRRKYTPQICNVHRVWKILSCIILRRRKDDCGEDIVPKIQHVVNVPMGLTQAAVYQYHLNAKYLDHKGKPAYGAKLQALRVTSANPASELLKPQRTTNTCTTFVGSQSYIPKVATGLELACQAMQRGEQILIGSAFHDGLDAFSERLTEAGIPHLVLDGRKTQKVRGELARAFKAGPPRAVREGLTKKASQYPIMLAGVESMAELHNFYLCNNVILTAYSWAFDKFWQFISRAHRMTSPWPVNLWSLLCEGSIDPKLNDGVMEKKDASDLVLDGRLLGDDTTEVNLADLLDHAFKQFANIKVVDEGELAKGWPRLRANLCQAYRQWLTGTYTVIPPAINAVRPTIGASGAGTACLPLWKQRFRLRRRN